MLGSQTASVHDRCGGNAGSAAAADLPSRRPPPPVAYAPPLPIFTWTGFYVGVNGGGAFRGNNNSGFNNAVFFGGARPFVGAGLANNNSGNSGRSIGGGQAGFNWQIQPVRGRC